MPFGQKVMSFSFFHPVQTHEALQSITWRRYCKCIPRFPSTAQISQSCGPSRAVATASAFLQLPTFPDHAVHHSSLESYRRCIIARPPSTLETKSTHDANTLLDIKPCVSLDVSTIFPTTISLLPLAINHDQRSSPEADSFRTFMSAKRPFMYKF